MSDSQPGLVPLAPEDAAALPGPPVQLPQLPAAPAPEPVPAPEPDVVEVVAPRARAPEPAPMPAAEPPAPAATEPALATAETARPVRPVPGPRGTLAALPDDLVEVGGLFEMLRRSSRIQPPAAPSVRAQDFIEINRRQIMVRSATAEEAEQVAQIMGSQTPEQVRLISTRGAYMPTDAQEFISAVRLANERLFADMRRGVQTREQQIELATRMGFDGAVEALLRRAPGETLNNEGLIAGSLAVINATRETELARAALAALPAGSVEEADALIRFGLNHALTAAIAGQLNGAAAEAGRALGALRFVQDALNQVPGSARGQVGPEALRVPGVAAMGDNAASIIEQLGGAEVLRAQAAAWAALPDAASRTRFAQRSAGARVVDAVIAAYVNSLLWLPTTHIRNIMGTSAMMMWSIPERALAGAIGQARTALRLGSDERVVMGEALAQLYGMWAGQGEAISAAAQAFRTNQPVTGFSRLELPDRINPISAEAFQLSGVPGQAVDLLGTVLTAPGRALVTADSYFQIMGSRMELLAQAVRTRDGLIRAGMSRDDAAREVERLLANPPQTWRDAAEATARGYTFQDEMTGGLAALRDVMQHPLAKLYVPFFNTPTNVARAVFNRTPLALTIPGQVWADLRAGGARADLAMARMALGSTLMWWFSGMVMNLMTDPDLRITGSEPGEPARREAYRRQGLQPFSFCTREDGGWVCRSFAGFDPLSGLLAMAADAVQYQVENPLASVETDDALAEMAMGAVFGLYEYMLDQPFLSGVSELARTLVGNNNMNTRQRFERAVEMTSEVAASAIVSPLTFGTLGGGIERAMDPTLRSAMLADPEIAQSAPAVRGFYQALQRAQTRLPGASEGLQPTLNIWGQEVRPTAGGMWELFWPIRTTQGGQADLLEETLLRLGGVLALPDRQFPGTNVRLTAGQYNALLREMNDAGNRAGNGQTMREELAELVGTPGFDMQDPRDQIEQIRGVRARRWRAAQEAVLGLDLDLDRRVVRDREYRQHMGVSPREEGAPIPMPAIR